MLQKFMLDTDTASYALREGSVALRNRLRHQRPDSLCISVVSVAELLYGVRHLGSEHPASINVQALLQSAFVPLWDIAAAHAYADVRSNLTQKGLLIGELDMMIAAHALSIDAILVTNNTRHYGRISPPLRVENWAQA